jgi:hypothetical protein
MTNLPTALPGRDSGAGMESIEEVLNGGVASENSQAAKAVESSKMKERSGNVVENKGSRLENRERSGNVVENEPTYPQYGGMLLKTKDVSPSLALGDRC